jgi:hypothetical protein
MRRQLCLPAATAEKHVKQSQRTAPQQWNPCSVILAPIRDTCRRDVLTDIIPYLRRRLGPFDFVL